MLLWSVYRVLPCYSLQRHVYANMLLVCSFEIAEQPAMQRLMQENTPLAQRLLAGVLKHVCTIHGTKRKQMKMLDAVHINSPSIHSNDLLNIRICIHYHGFAVVDT